MSTKGHSGFKQKTCLNNQILLFFFLWIELIMNKYIKCDMYQEGVLHAMLLFCFHIGAIVSLVSCINIFFTVALVFPV